VKISQYSESEINRKWIFVVVVVVVVVNEVDGVLTTTSGGRAGLTGVGVAGLVVEFCLDMMMTVDVLPDLCSGM